MRPQNYEYIWFFWEKGFGLTVKAFALYYNLSVGDFLTYWK
jgi:hypothetical protein